MLTKKVKQEHVINRERVCGSLKVGECLCLVGGGD